MIRRRNGEAGNPARDTADSCRQPRRPARCSAFQAESGISETEWLRYWPRWSDAVREAGFAPNTKKTAYSDSFLVEKVIELARRLGRLPTYQEKRHERLRGAEFPSEKAFRRLGSQREMIKKVLEYCRTHEGHDDIVVLCPPPASSTESQEKQARPAQPDGFVYLSRMGRHYKIGRTNAAGRRERELAIQLPEKSTTVHLIRTDDPIGIEAYWHKQFEPKRRNGEWFELGKEDVAAFRRRKFM